MIYAFAWIVSAIGLSMIAMLTIGMIIRHIGAFAVLTAILWLILTTINSHASAPHAEIDCEVDHHYGKICVEIPSNLIQGYGKTYMKEWRKRADKEIGRCLAKGETAPCDGPMGKTPQCYDHCDSPCSAPGRKINSGQCEDDQ